MKTTCFCESLNEFWSLKCGAREIKQCLCVMRPDVGVLWVGGEEFFDAIKKEDLREIVE